MKNFLKTILILTIIFTSHFVFAEEIVDTPTDDTQIQDINPTPTQDPADDSTQNLAQDSNQDPIQTQNSNTNTPTTQSHTVLVRSGDNVVFSGVFDIPNSGIISITDSSGVIHDVNANSALGLFYLLDQTNDNFSISNLTYYSSFGAFYIKCLDIAGVGELCDNWQYVVGGTTPWTSVDATMLSGGENVGLYFGTPHQVLLDKNSIEKDTSIIATAQKYNYEDNTWSPLLGVSIGITQPNPNDPWNPTVITSSTVDNVSGSATFTLSNVGEYNVGIVEDFYFPSYKLSVTEPLVNTNTGGGGSSTVKSFDTANASAYLLVNQATDGSFGGSDLYTDWAVIGLGAYGISTDTKEKVLMYMKSHNTKSSILTDNERRAMALLALGQNPYDFEGVNYIEEITKSFDGTQFGDKALMNDDAFAILVLTNSGLSKNDDMIKGSLDFILSKQSNDGSWESSVDMTSATIQILSIFKNKNEALDAITKGINYLKYAQGADGSLGNVFATSWALQASKVLGENINSNGKTGEDFLASKQEGDGGVLLTTDTLVNRIWATSYAIPAVLGKSWDGILIDVEKPAEKESIQGETNNDTKEIPKTEEAVTEKVVENIVDKIKIETTAEPIQIKKTETKSINQIELANNDIVASTLSANAESSTKNFPKILFGIPIVLLSLYLGFKFL